mmetsp:Transcript_32284/g.75405  ORF Transcript_32284/g.75405 Transcript_32284/m.75405 type:complete len:86 (+) Transcript_32284:770-1027(+)
MSFSLLRSGSTSPIAGFVATVVRKVLSGCSVCIHALPRSSQLCDLDGVFDRLRGPIRWQELSALGARLCFDRRFGAVYSAGTLHP